MSLDPGQILDSHRLIVCPTITRAGAIRYQEAVRDGTERVNLIWDDTRMDLFSQKARPNVEHVARVKAWVAQSMATAFSAG